MRRDPYWKDFENYRAGRWRDGRRLRGQCQCGSGRPKFKRRVRRPSLRYKSRWTHVLWRDLSRENPRTVPRLHDKWQRPFLVIIFILADLKAVYRWSIPDANVVKYTTVRFLQGWIFSRDLVFRKSDQRIRSHWQGYQYRNSIDCNKLQLHSKIIATTWRCCVCCLFTNWRGTAHWNLFRWNWNKLQFFFGLKIVHLSNPGRSSYW